VQIGAFSSQALADSNWAAAVQAPGGAGKGKHVELVPGKGLYRTTVTGFGSRADAAAFCNALKASGKSCFVK
jgi:cell division protein FtsN